ncbi:MAG: DUF3592 domain-containing protein [Bacilli bacterium]
MAQAIKKYRSLLLIVGLISIICGLIIFTIIFTNYQEGSNFIKESSQVEGYVFNVTSLGKDKYSFEYKYRVDNKEYKKFISSMKLVNGLKNDDKITVYYNKEKVNENMIKKPSINAIYIAVAFLVVFVAIGTINIIKYFKK